MILKMKKVLIIEDDSILAESIKGCLASQLYQIQIESDGNKGYNRAVNGDWDLILLDINLPVKSGFVIARDLRKAGIETPIIAITGRSDTSSRITCWQMGFDKILQKPFTLAELNSCIEATLKRPERNSRLLIKHLDLEYDESLHCLKRENTYLPLRKKEVDIFLCLLRNKGRVISREKLYKAVYDWDSETLESTLDVHMSHLRRKLNLGRKEAYDYIKTIHSRGYIVE